MADQLPRSDCADSLQPFLKRLAAEVAAAPASGAFVLDAEGARIGVDSWQAHALRSALGRGEAAVDFAAHAVALAIAWRWKTAADLATAAAMPPAADGALSPPAAELQQDLLRGVEVASMSQEAVNRLVAEARLDDAKRLSQVRHTVRSELGRVQEALDALGAAQPVPPRAEEAAPTGGTAPKSDTFRIDTGIFDDPTYKKRQEQVQEEKRRRMRQRREAEERRRRIKRLGLMLGALVVLVAIWVVAILLPALRRPHIPMLTAQDFAGIPAVESVLVRPPSVFITVDSQRWNALNESQRVSVVQSVGAVLAPNSYAGAVLQTGTGTVVGQWLRSGGARLVATPKPQAGDN